MKAMSFFLLIGVLMIFAQTAALATNETVMGGASSWGPYGLFCFSSRTETNNHSFVQVHLVRYVDGKIEPLFTKSVSRAGYSPICFSNGVVDVTAYGEVRKFDLKGNIVFEKKPKDFEGASAMSGKISDTCIFLTETLQDKENNLIYHLYVVDISGTLPVVKGKFNIPQPWKIVRTFEGIVVIGQKDTLRFNVPEDSQNY